ncbi:hypothetical protein [Colwellia piezophila]|uniref:hypothetical protein n=1 Tax=Colwellia piezophila TaxID=211668 RepID=UPI0003823021|nr:hypothetical protein [Colwellia piezophila]
MRAVIVSLVLAFGLVGCGSSSEEAELHCSYHTDYTVTVHPDLEVHTLATNLCNEVDEIGTNNNIILSVHTEAVGNKQSYAAFSDSRDIYKYSERNDRTDIIGWDTYNWYFLKDGSPSYIAAYVNGKTTMYHDIDMTDPRNIEANDHMLQLRVDAIDAMQDHIQFYK